MTELIVALDGPAPFTLACKLYSEDVPCWFKIGPQAMAHSDWQNLMRIPYLWGRFVFLDLKLYDTADTVRECVKRFTDAGIIAISTWTNTVTEVALEAAGCTPLRIWQLLVLSDDADPKLAVPYCVNAHGLICPPTLLLNGCRDAKPADLVVPGVRFLVDDPNGHAATAMPSAVRAYGGTHAIVGRPIWQAKDPISAARAYLEVLNGPEPSAD